MHNMDIFAANIDKISNHCLQPYYQMGSTPPRAERRLCHFILHSHYNLLCDDKATWGHWIYCQETWWQTFSLLVCQITIECYRFTMSAQNNGSHYVFLCLSSTFTHTCTAGVCVFVFICEGHEGQKGLWDRDKRALTHIVTLSNTLK